MLVDRRLLRLAWDHRRYFVLATISGIAGGVLSLWQARLFSRIVNDVFLMGKGFDGVQDILILLLGVLTLRSFLLGGQEFFSNYGCYFLKLRIRSNLINAISRIWKPRGNDTATGDVPTILIDRVDSLDSYFGQYLPQVFQAGILPPILLLTVFFIDPLSGVVFLLTGPLIPFFMRLIGEAARQQTEKQWQRLSQLSSFLFEAILALPMLKRLGISRTFTRYLDENGRSYRDATLEVLRISFLSALVLEMLTTLSTAIVAVQVGLRLLYGWITLEQALFVLLIAPEYYLPLRLLGQKFHAGISGVSGGKRVLSLLNQSEQAENLPEDIPIAERNQPRMFWSNPIHEIRLIDVGYRYPLQESGLKGINFSLRTNSITALVGESGSGKTTIAHLLLGLIKPAEGKILVGDHPLEEIPFQEWWDSIGWVAQQPYLFHGTIRENITFGSPSVTNEEVEVAARMANAWDFIREFPLGLDTVIGEYGMGLSSGQAQRIALARAYLKNAPVLIWDEGGANIDVDSLELILQSLRQYSQGRIVLLISHQPQVVKIADQIVNVEEFQSSSLGDAHPGISASLLDLQDLENRAESFDGELDNLAGSHPQIGQSVNLSEPSIQLRFDPSRNHQRKALGFYIINLVSLLLPLWKWIGLAVLLTVLAIWSNIGLMFSSAYIITFAALQPSIALLQVAIVGVRFFGISRGVWRYLERLTSHRVTLDLLNRLRVRFFQLLEERTPKFFLKFSSGEVLSRLLGDINTLEPFYVRSVAPFLSAFVVGLGMLIFVGLFLPEFFWALFITYGIAGVCLPVLYYQLARRLTLEQNRNRGSSISLLIRVLHGFEELLVYGYLSSAKQELKDRLGRYTRSVWKSGLLLSSQVFGTNLLAFLAMWLCLATAIPSVETGSLNGVYLAGITLAVYVSFEAFTGLPNAAQVMVNGGLAAERLFELMESIPVQSDANGQKTLLPQDEVNLSIRNLRFTYPGISDPSGEPEPVIEDFSLEIPAGKRIAIVGPSGAGKSTILRILLGLYPIQNGEILINGERLSSYDLVNWRNSVASCAQDDFLFHTTVEKNLTILASPENTHRLNEVLEKTGLTTVIQELPLGYQTIVGEHGGHLSGGEQKRFLIARTLMRDSHFYFLDEPFAELDEVTAKLVLRGIESVTKGKTLVVISHLPWGMENFDEIIVLEAGRITQRGKHQDLIQQEGYYSRLYQVNRN